MNLAGLTARCRAMVDELDLPRPFDVHALCAEIERRRRRPIVLLGLPLPEDSPCGLWISTDRRDYIVYEHATSALHREHIIVHELSHLLCGHTGNSVMGDEAARRLFPTLDPDVVRRVLGRNGYSSEEEQEAELLASMILHRAERYRRAPRLSDNAAWSLRRLESGL